MSAPQGNLKVPLSTRFAFGVGDFGFVVVWQGTALFLMYFYTDVLGIAPAVAGAIYLVAMIWDAITDPFIATLAERTRSRIGRYRPWMLLGALPFALSYPLAFSSPISPAITPWVWAFVTHITLRTTFTLVSMPFNAMPARLTQDANERSVLTGFRMIGAATGGLAIVVLTPVGVSMYGEGREAEAYFAVACVAGTLAFLGLLYCAAVMREPDIAEEGVKTSFFSDLADVLPLFLKNGHLIRVFAIIAIGSVCLGMFGKNILYHFKYDAVRPDLVLPALVLPAILMIFTTPIWVKLANVTSKRRSLTVGLLIALIGYLIFFLNPSTNIAISMASICLIGIGGAAFPVMFWSMLPDTVEYGEAVTGVRAEARTFGFATFAQKSAVGINALVLGGLLSVSGFEANAEQTTSTLFAMKAIMALVPAMGVIALLFILRGYTLDQSTHAALVQQTRDA